MVMFTRDGFHSGRVVRALGLAIVLAVGLLAGPAWGDFTLTGDQHLDLTSDGGEEGYLYDTSSVEVFPAGSVTAIMAYDTSKIVQSGGNVLYFGLFGSSLLEFNDSNGGMAFIGLYDSGRAVVGGGEVNTLQAIGDNSSVDLSGGKVGGLELTGSNSSAVMSAGTITYLELIGGNSSVDMSGGNVAAVSLTGSSNSINMTGGTVNTVRYDLDPGYSGPPLVTVSGSGKVNMSLTTTLTPRGASHITCDAALTAYLRTAPGTSLAPGSVSSFEQELVAYDASVVDVVSGAEFDVLSARDASTVNFTGGTVRWLAVGGSSTVEITGGEVADLHMDNGTLDLWGGQIQKFHYYKGVTTFHGKDFELGDGLTLNGDQLLGWGTLTGKWLDGTAWSLDIPETSGDGVVLLVPEPASLAMLAVGCVSLLRRRRR